MTKSPIITKTVKSLESGRYGIVNILTPTSKGGVSLGLFPSKEMHWFTEKELRATAKTLLEIADFLEGEDK